jgi:dimethylglycine dehydrogenase
MYEAGLERFLNLDVGDFMGRQATLDGGAGGRRLAIVYMEIEDGDNDAQGNERVFHDGRVVGLTTSGAFGHTTGKSLAFGYVEPGLDHPGTEFEVLLLGEMRRATVLAEAAYDPTNSAMRA